MSNSLSAKILRKSVGYGKGWGGTDQYSFLVYHNGEEKWVSQFADPKKIAADVIQLLKELGEGDRAEFVVEENVGKKDGKTYLNIVGLTREIDVHDDVPAEVQPSGKAGQAEAPRDPKGVHPPGGAKSGESDTRVRSMALAYAKDLAVQGKLDPDTHIESFVLWAKRFEQYILTGD